MNKTTEKQHPPPPQPPTVTPTPVAPRGCDVTCVAGFVHLLDAVYAPLIRLGDVQHAQVGQGDCLGRLQGGADRRPAHQVVVDAGHLAVDGPARHNANLQALRHLIGRRRRVDVVN